MTCLSPFAYLSLGGEHFGKEWIAWLCLTSWGVSSGANLTGQMRFIERSVFTKGNTVGGAEEQTVLAVLGAETQAHRVYVVTFYEALMGREQEVLPEITLSTPLFSIENLRPKREEKLPQSHTLVTDRGETRPEGS